MIASLTSFKKSMGVSELEFAETSTGRQMCITRLPEGVPQIFVAKGLKKDECTHIWDSHPKDEPGKVILIIGNTRMKEGWTL
jgi:hypothetical protein